MEMIKETLKSYQKFIENLEKTLEQFEGETQRKKEIQSLVEKLFISQISLFEQKMPNIEEQDIYQKLRRKVSDERLLMRTNTFFRPKKEVLNILPNKM